MSTKFQISGAPTTRIVYIKGVFERTTNKETKGNPKYNSTLLIPKDDEKKVAQVKAMFDQAFAELQAKGFSGTLKSIPIKNLAFIDGEDYADAKKGREAFRPYYLLKTSSPEIRPLVFDKEKLVIFNGVPVPGMDAKKYSSEELGDGDYVIANVSFWSYNNSNAQGIGANLHALMRMEAGERITGASQDADDYISLEDYE